MLSPPQATGDSRVGTAPASPLPNPTSSTTKSQQPLKMRVIASSDGEESSDESDGEGGLAAILGPSKNARAPVTPKIFKPPKPVSIPKRELKFNMQKLQAGIRSSNNVEENRRKIAQCKKEMEQNAIDPLTADDSDMIFEAAIPGGDTNKLKRALQKKMDKYTEECYEFFESIVTPRQTTCAFPVDKSLRSIFSGTDDADRETMFLSGFVRDVVECDGSVISDDQIHWLMNEVCVQKRSDLVLSYVKVLQAISEPQLRKIFTPSGICQILQAIGAKSENLDVASHLKLAMVNPASRPRCSFLRLKLVARLLADFVDCSDTDVLVTTCCLLLRASLDVRVCLHSDVLLALEDAVAVILSTVDHHNWEEKSRILGNALLTTFVRAQDRRQVLERLPILTSQLHTFRRRLALSFLLEDESFIQQLHINLPDLDRFCALTEQQPFVIHSAQNSQHATDYDQLEAMLNIVDIALDSGPTSGSSVEKDRAADKFEHRITMIEGRISDATMGHSKRTSSKEGAERLKFRAAFTIRSKTKKGLEQLTLDGIGFGKH